MRADRVLTEARTLLDGIDAELRNYEQTRHQRDEQALAQRERISQRKLDQQALVLSADTLQAAVEKAGFVLQDVLNALPRTPAWATGSRPCTRSTHACAGWSRSTWPPSTSTARLRGVRTTWIRSTPT